MPPIWNFITDFGDTAVTVPLALLMVGFLVAAKEPRLAVGWGLAIVGCAGAIGALKIFLISCGYPLAGPDLASPSGHTAMSIGVYGGFAAVAGATLARPGRAAVAIGAAALAIGIALSRIILGAHSRLEVAVGAAIGIAALGAILAVVARYRPARLPLVWLSAGTIVVAVLFHGNHWAAEQGIHSLAGLFGIIWFWCR